MQVSFDPIALLAITVILLLVLLAVSFFKAPGHFVRDLPDLGPPPASDRFIPLNDQLTIHADHEKRRNDLRIGLLQAIAGLAVLTTLVSTLLQLQTNQKIANDQQDLTRRGQIADRFTKAIDQLGQGAPDKLDVRLGGIYGLEQVARDSPNDRTRLAIFEVLTAYVRDHASWSSSASMALDSVSDLQARAPDIQAIITVLGRRQPLKGDPALDLHRVDLRRARLGGADLEGTNLNEAHLEGTDLITADLRGADLGGAHLERAVLREAHLEKASLGGAHLEGAILNFAHLERAVVPAYLQEANLIGTHLEGANLGQAHLEGASLIGAHLEKAILISAHLEGAHLRQAHLEGADLRSAVLTGAEADKDTTWPSGFDWRAAGVKPAS